MITNEKKKKNREKRKNYSNSSKILSIIYSSSPLPVHRVYIYQTEILEKKIRTFEGFFFSDSLIFFVVVVVVAYFLHSFIHLFIPKKKLERERKFNLNLIRFSILFFSSTTFSPCPHHHHYYYIDVIK